jgi:hypothetical protein
MRFKDMLAEFFFQIFSLAGIGAAFGELLQGSNLCVKLFKPALCVQRRTLMNIKKGFSDSRLRFWSHDDAILPHLKRNPVLEGKGFEELSYRAPFPPLGLLQAPAHATNALEQFLVIEELLIGFGALDHDLCLAVDGQHSRVACLLEFANVIARVALEFAQ